MVKVWKGKGEYFLKLKNPRSIPFSSRKDIPCTMKSFGALERLPSSVNSLGTWSIVMF